MTPREFAGALLVKLDAPISTNNIAALVAAQAIEGGAMHNAAAYNPMNTTQPMPGATSATPVGVKAYTSWEQGIDATAKTLKNGRYENILAKLRASAEPDDTLAQDDWRTWGWVTSIGKAESYASYADATFPAQTKSRGAAFAIGAALAVLGAIVLFKKSSNFSQEHPMGGQRRRA